LFYLDRLLSSSNFSFLQHDLGHSHTGCAQLYPQALWTIGQAVEIVVNKVKCEYETKNHGCKILPSYFTFQASHLSVQHSGGLLKTQLQYKVSQIF